MRTIENMLTEIGVLLTQYDNVVEYIFNYVNVLTQEEVFYAIGNMPFQQIADFLNSIPNTDEMCCGFHYSQSMLKIYLLYNFRKILGNTEPNNLNEFT
jgi:hypothetical protein